VWSDYGRYKLIYVLIKDNLYRFSLHSETPVIHSPISLLITTAAVTALASSTKKATNLLNTIKISANEIGNLHIYFKLAYTFAMWELEVENRLFICFCKET